jgi:hypothetical protein
MPSKGNLRAFNRQKMALPEVLVRALNGDYADIVMFYRTSEGDWNVAHGPIADGTLVVGALMRMIGQIERESE